jgi:hypothetical protein
MIKNPFGVGSFKDSAGRFKQHGQNQHDFSGWADRLSKIEEGIGRLTEQFKNFQGPMEQEGMEKQIQQDPMGGIANLPQLQSQDPSLQLGQGLSGGLGSFDFGTQPTQQPFDPNALAMQSDPVGSPQQPPSMWDQNYRQQLLSQMNPNAFTPAPTDPNAAVSTASPVYGHNFPMMPGTMMQEPVSTGINGLASLISQQGYQV